MPQVGEVRRGQTESVQWDGSRWQPIAHQPTNDSFVGDLFHGITEHPLDTLKGFIQGGATGLPTAAKIVQTVAPIVTGGASIPAQMAVGAGTQMLSDLADKAAGDPNSPATFGDFLEHAAVGGGLAGAFAGGTRLLKAVPDTALSVASKIPGKIGLAAKAAQALRSIAPEAEGMAQDYRPSVPKTMRFGPGNDIPNASPSFEPHPVSAEPPIAVDRYMPNKSVSEIPPSIEHLGGRAENFGEIPVSTEGQVEPTSADAKDFISQLQRPSIAHLQPTAAEPQVQPSSSEVDDLISSMTLPNVKAGASAPIEALPNANAEAPIPFKTLERGDEFWGPGSTNRAGQLSMADESNRMLYDPQTPTDYLRQQLSEADNPADREFLAKTIRQRYDIQQRPSLTGLAAAR